MNEDMDLKTMTTVLITTVVMSSFAFAFSRITNRQRERLMQLATKDPLTGVGNRRGLDVKLKDIVNNHKRSGMIASMLLLDLDHFKKVNDAHGHAVGDQTLKRVTEIINLRIFVVVLEGQDAMHAKHLAEQLRTLIQANELVPDQPVTISTGVAEIAQDETASSWLGRADGALYRAKHAGRNTTSIAE
jgi:diguanylate cyclase (GGDEF)-like protein